MAEIENTVVTTSLEFRIEDFVTATEELHMHKEENLQNFVIEFSASVFANGVDKDTEGWLVIRPDVNVRSYRSSINTFDLWWIVSVIDSEGSSKFTRYFGKYADDFIKEKGHDIINEEGHGFKGEKYFEKSFIINRADEFLIKGVLFLRCDIYYDMHQVKQSVSFDAFLDFIGSIPQVRCFKNIDEKGVQLDIYKVFDFTYMIIDFPPFHTLRRKFGVKNILPELTPFSLLPKANGKGGILPMLSSFSSKPKADGGNDTLPKLSSFSSEPNGGDGTIPELLSFSSDPKADGTDILADVWIFDTRPDKFLISLGPLPGSVGSLLVNASTVIRQCINVPMKEQREKRIHLSNVDSETFHMVLFFLQSGELPNLGFSASVKAYQFSHLHEMENLQRKCAERMIEVWEIRTRLKEIEALAHMYSDAYLQSLLVSKRREFKNSDGSIMDDRPDSNCYI